MTLESKDWTMRLTLVAENKIVAGLAIAVGEFLLVAFVLWFVVALARLVSPAPLNLLQPLDGFG